MYINIYIYMNFASYHNTGSVLASRSNNNSGSFVHFSLIISKKVLHTKNVNF
jgi:hypothetical protein